MAQIRSSRWWGGLTVALSLAFVVGVSLLMGLHFGAAAKPGAATAASATASATPSAISRGAIPAPDAAVPLTATVLDSVEPGWILTTYDSSSGSFRTDDVRTPASSPSPHPATSAGTTPTWDTPGTRHVFVVDRVGTVYQGADMGVDSTLEIRLWLPDRRTAIVARPEAPGSDHVVLYSFDILTGALSAPFDGPSAAPPYEATTQGASPAPSPASTAPGPAAGASPVWIGGDVRLAASGDALLVSDGTDIRQLVRLTLDGRAVAQAVPPAPVASFVDDPNGQFTVAGEFVTTVNQRWVEDTQQWVEYTDQHWNTVTYARSPTGNLAADRVDHGAPVEEGTCQPAVWAKARQLLETCTRADGATVLYTVAASTSTFVRAAVFSTIAADPFFSVKPDGTRVAVGDRVYTIVGDVSWSLPASEPIPTGLAWSGDLLVLWGSAGEQVVPGHGASELRAHDAFTGEITYALTARHGEAGFGPVIAAS